MSIELNRSVREVTLEIPGATRIFEAVGIDYCCGGQQSLTDACAKAGIRVDDLMASLELAKTSSKQHKEPDFLNFTLAELVDHIIETHHVFTRTEIERLRVLLDKVFGVHGQNHPELARVRSLFEMLRLELEPHMMKEERVLFPYVIEIEDAISNKRAVTTPPFITVGNPVRMMMLEHDRAGELLKQIRQVTSDYTPPSDACISYQTLYQALAAFEKDLHQHIHLENNVLFPKAVEMEGTNATLHI